MDARSKQSVEQLFPWAERLLNLSAERCAEGVARVRSWGLSSIERELLSAPDLDTVCAATQLAEDVRDLVAQGTPETKLFKKLRDAKTTDQFWPVWAEIRAAAILIGHPDVDARIDLEPDRRGRAHADFRLSYEDGTSVAIEFKAIGLADREVEWHARADRAFDSLLPPVGLTTAHGLIDQEIRVNDAKRQRSWEKAHELSDAMRGQFPQWADLRGVAIVGHEAAPQNYLARAKARIEKALRQLSADEESWVALWWSNGAPFAAAKRLIDAVKAPRNVSGLIFLGQAVAVPWSEVQVYIAPMERGADPADRHVQSTVHDVLAGQVLDRFESSSGLRPTLLQSPEPMAWTLLRRDGRRRIFPFNLLFDSDPRELAQPWRPPSPIQDVHLDR